MGLFRDRVSSGPLRDVPKGGVAGASRLANFLDFSSTRKHADRAIFTLHYLKTISTLQVQIWEDEKM